MHSRSLFLLAALLGSGCSDDGRSDQAISGSGGLSTTGTGASPETSAAGTSAAGVSEGSGGSAASSTTGDDAESSSDGSSGVPGTDGGSTGSEDDSSTGVAEGSSTDSSDSDDSSGVVDGVLDIGIIAHNDCTFTVEPASITVTEGTAFTVNWVSSPASEVEFDIAKIDPFNQVPIVIGMEPGGAYHDDIREWCGDLFTGTFEFRLTSCYDPLYIPVDCGG